MADASGVQTKLLDTHDGKLNMSPLTEDDSGIELGAGGEADPGALVRNYGPRMSAYVCALVCHHEQLKMS